LSSLFIRNTIVIEYFKVERFGGLVQVCVGLVQPVAAFAGGSVFFFCKSEKVLRFMSWFAESKNGADYDCKGYEHKAGVSV